MCDMLRTILAIIGIIAVLCILVPIGMDLVIGCENIRPGLQYTCDPSKLLSWILNGIKDFIVMILEVVFGL